MRGYFDHNSTTPLSAPVLAAMLPVYADVFGNASSIHTYGQSAAIWRTPAARSPNS